MPYKVGISSGWWSIGKDPSLLGLAIKAGGYGATSGVQFNQVDLDTILEFNEPDIKRQVERMQKQLGIEVGLHGEINEPAALETAERRIWDLSHERLIITLKHAANLGFKYVNIHLSNSIQLQQRERELRPFGWSYQIVSPYGKPFRTLAEDGTAGGNAVRDFIKRRMQSGSGIQRNLQEEEFFQNKSNMFNDRESAKEEAEAIRRIDAGVYNRGERPIPPGTRTRSEIEAIMTAIRRERQNTGEWNKLIIDFYYGLWNDPGCKLGQFVLEAGEIDAALATAIYMYHNKESLWSSIVGNVEPEVAYTTMPKEFNAATAGFYLHGHFTAKHPANDKYIGGATIMEFLKKHEIILTMETPQSGQGTEGLSRLYDPIDGYYLSKWLNSPKIKLCIDFEQVMGQNIPIDPIDANDPSEVKRALIPRLPKDFGTEVRLIHLGEPIPYFGTAHIPIAIGGRGQEYLYRWIFEFRKRGFKDGWILFERGSGRGGEGRSAFQVFEYSVWVLRQMVKYLEQDMEPDKLPPEFYGISLENKDIWATQVINMREHAWDPLKDLFIMPEEEHMFFGKAAIDKGKGEVWNKRKYR